jgi:lysophospholipase L1-like esterase
VSKGNAKTSGAVVIAALLAAVALGGASKPSKGSVSVWGDSLTVEARSPLVAAGAKVHAVGGTAPCDWSGSFESRLSKDNPSQVMLAFVGNYGSPCMAGTRTDAQRAELYRVALARMASIAIRHKVTVTFIVPPYMAPNRAFYLLPFGAPEITRMECALAATDPRWLRCDTHARDALAVNGGYAAARGDTPLRTDDGIHLTAYGARLYARGILAAPSAPGAKL